MLVLTRRSGESILIGDDIRVRVLSSSGSRVRIGIEAPAEVPILREQPSRIKDRESRIDVVVDPLSSLVAPR